MNLPGRGLALALLLGSAAGAGAAGPVEVDQGGLARWSGLAAQQCGFLGRRFDAVDAVCYYPVDLHARAGVHDVTLYDQDGQQHRGQLRVRAVEFARVEMTLPDDTFVQVSADNLKLHREQRRRVLALFKPADTPVRFSLPLAQPARAIPASADDFGSRRLFNGIRESQHTGRDAPVGQGSAVKAIADGTVVLAEHQFFTGNSVFIDHGGGLVSMNFHLHELAVATGDQVRRGQKVGTVGATGRATGPHLHLGVRWHNARIDPLRLIESPGLLPDIGAPASAD